MSETTIKDPFADDQEADDFAASFTPNPIATETTKAAEKTALAAADSVADKQGFSSRRPRRKKTFRRSDNLRTGRNELISIKGRLEDKERLGAIADAREWVNGQTLQYALDALAEKIDNPQDKFWKTHNFHGVD